MKERVLEVKGICKGTIRRIISELNCGFISNKKHKEDIFFSVLTEFKNTSYKALNEGDPVEVFVVRTSRGLFAKNLLLKRADVSRSKKHCPSHKPKLNHQPHL